MMPRPQDLLLGALLAAALPLAAQTADPARAVAQLEAEWDAARAKGELVPPAAQRAAIEALLRTHDTVQTAPIWRLRLRLAELELCRFAVTAALQQFDRVTAEAPLRATDLHGEAALGAASCRLALGETEVARAAFERLRDELTGTRYAAHAQAALQRIDAQRPSAAAGDRVPALPRLLDLSGRAQELGFPRGAPTLLLFWSPDVPATVDALDRVAEQWSLLGLPRENLLTFGLADSPELLREVRRSLGVDVTVVPCQRGALDPSVVTLRVDALPALILLGPDGTILARDFAAARLRELLPARR